MARIKGQASSPAFRDQAQPPPSWFLRLPNVYRRRWRQTRDDGTAFEKSGVGWIVKAHRFWTFLPVDQKFPPSRNHHNIESAFRAADRYEDLISRRS